MFSTQLISALFDYRYLLDRNYPKKAGIELVGNRYELSRTQRSILYRGTTDRNTACRRFKRLTGKPVSGKLHIDAYNILFILANYLLGRPVFISDDGLLRDAGEQKGRFSNKERFEQARALLEEFMIDHTQFDYILYLDMPVSNSGKLASSFRKLMIEHSLEGEAFTCYSPDSQIVLNASEEDFIVSGDSVIIDETLSPIFDLSCHLLKEAFSIEPFNIHTLFDIC